MINNELLKLTVFLNKDESQEVLAKIENLSYEFERAKRNKPYHINVIDELHANENAHSRILNKLLSYSRGSEYPILQSFVKKLQNWDDNNRINYPVFSTEKERIDCLVEEQNSYAIIIENKINGAVDQQKQLERYITSVRNHSIPEHLIWVVYLTIDGTKAPEDYSLTDTAKELVGDRYSPLNYHDDILPWLRDDILPSCMIKEEWLISAIKQYVDHLEGLFQERKDDEIFNNMMTNKIKEQLGIQESLNIRDVYKTISTEENRIEEVLNLIKNTRRSIEDSILNDFTEITKNYFNKCEFKVNHSEFMVNDRHESMYGNGYYQIRPNEWPSCIHLEWVPFNMNLLMNETSLCLVLHIEGNRNDERLIGLKRKICEDGEYRSKVPDCEHDNRKFYEKTYTLAKPFVFLSSDEKKNFLQSVYEESIWLIDLIDRNWDYS